MNVNSASQEKEKLLVSEEHSYTSFPLNNNGQKEEISDEEIDPADIMSIQKGQKPLRYHFYAQVNKMISTSFAMMAALAWNEAIKELFVEVFGADSAGTTVSLFIYATVITVAVVLVVYYIGRLAQMVEKFDRKTSAYVKQQKLKIKQQLKKTKRKKSKSSLTDDVVSSLKM